MLEIDEKVIDACLVLYGSSLKFLGFSLFLQRFNVRSFEDFYSDEQPNSTILTNNCSVLRKPSEMMQIHSESILSYLKAKLDAR